MLTKSHFLSFFLAHRNIYLTVPFISRFSHMIGLWTTVRRAPCLFLPPPYYLSPFQSYLPWWLPAMFQVAAPHNGRSSDASFTAWRRDSQETCLACIGQWRGREINLYHVKPWRCGDCYTNSYWLSWWLLKANGLKIGESRYCFSLTSDSATGLTWHYFTDIRICRMCTSDWPHSSRCIVGWYKEGACTNCEQQRSRI